MLDTRLVLYSSNKMMTQTLASMTQAEPLKRLIELANLRDDPAGFERFNRRWPTFIHVPDNDLPYTLAAPITGILNLPNRFLHMWQRRQDLRKIWRGNTDTLKAVLSPGTPPEELQPEEQVDYVTKNESDAAGEWAWPPQVELDWQRSQLVYLPRTGFQKAVYELFRKSRLARVCANPDCAAPYFIASRASQQYCSDGCAEVFQRESKRQWWEKRGKEWRRNRSRRKRGKN
jgi:hypothetical protein